jgi:aminopeptidase N
MQKLFLLTLLVISLQGNAQILNDSEPHSCASHKMEMYKRIQKKSRAATYPHTLMSRYDVKHYFIDMEAERNTTVIKGATTMQVLTTASTDTFCFELNKNLILDSVKYNNVNLVFGRDANSITYAKFVNSVANNSWISVKMYYHGDAFVTASAAIGSGFDTGNSGLWGNQATWSLSEPYSAADWFACKQFLTDKADSVTVHVTTNNQNKVASNGKLIGVEPLANNKVKYKWHSNYIIDYYLISIAVAKYVDYTIYAHPAALPNDSIKIQNYVYDNANTLPFFKPQLDSLPLFLDNYCNLFTLYPFWKEKYGNAMAPFGGGMEHQTMTSIGNLSSMSTNTHELLHHWFGDFVTCKTWSDIYINEGITSYGEVLTIEKYRPAASLVTKLTNLNDEITSQVDGAIYFTDTANVGRIFSGRLSYDKGSMVTHTLRFVLGDTMFFRTMRNFLNQYGGSTASIDDLKLVAETTSGQNLTAFSNQWFYGEGHPIWNAEYFSTGNKIVLKVNHTGSMATNNLYQTPLEVKLLSPSGDTMVKVNINANTNTFLFPSNKTITGLQIDPNIKMARVIGTIVSNPNLTLDLQNVNNLNEVLQVITIGSTLSMINSTNNNIHANIFDIGGAKIKSIEVPKGNSNINLHNLPQGVYFITNKQGSVKFVFGN